MVINPCLSCGACCALFRASFYWAETSEFTPGGVPAELTVKINDFFVAMKGSEKNPPRCDCLSGEIGSRVCCKIYEKRSSICREFKPAWEDNEPSPRCDHARTLWGLNPLTPDSWITPEGFPKAA